jgi:hypothetical protein
MEDLDGNARLAGLEWMTRVTRATTRSSCGRGRVQQCQWIDGRVLLAAVDRPIEAGAGVVRQIRRECVRRMGTSWKTGRVTGHETQRR